MLENPSEWPFYSQIYDTYYGKYVADMEYLQRIWQQNWHSVLEIGVGTGRLLPFFQKQDVCKYVGLDNCEHMLDEAFKKSHPAGFELINADLLQLDLAQEYDLILYAFNTANYILDAQSFEKHMKICSRALRPGGRIFLDLYIPFALRPGDHGVCGLRERVINNGSIYELYDRRFYDRQLRIEERHHTSRELQDGCLYAEIAFKTWRRYYSLGEIQTIAQMVGMRVDTVEQYGKNHIEGMYVTIAGTL
jgi:SAM-dependent methyltransferase